MKTHGASEQIKWWTLSLVRERCFLGCDRPRRTEFQTREQEGPKGTFSEHLRDGYKEAIVGRQEQLDIMQDGTK